MNIAFVCVCSEKYLPQYLVLKESLKKHAPDYPVLLYYGGPDDSFVHEATLVVRIRKWIEETKYTNPLYQYCSIRPRAVLDAFEKGYDAVILVGADTEFFAAPTACYAALDGDYEAFVTMYAHEPYPDPQSLYGNNLQVLENGQINADLIGFLACDQTRDFLKWLDKVLIDGCIINGKEYVDQVWMSMCFSFLDNVKVIRHPGYNVAHYNMIQRGMALKWVNQDPPLQRARTQKWVMNNNELLVMFHYAGFEKGKEEQISKHQNRYKAEGDILEFLKDYSRRI